MKTSRAGSQGPLQEYVEDPLILANDVQKFAPMLTPRALANMRQRRPEELRFHRILGRVYYRSSDLAAWLDHTVVSEEVAA